MATPTPADCETDRIHRQAVLSPGMGRELARALHRGPDQWIPGARTQVRQPTAGQQLSSRWLRPRWIVADLQTAAGLLSRRKDPGGRRHHCVSGFAEIRTERP